MSCQLHHPLLEDKGLNLLPQRKVGGNEEEGGKTAEVEGISPVMGYLVSLFIYLTLLAAGKVLRLCESCDFTHPVPHVYSSVRV